MPRSLIINTGSNVSILQPGVSGSDVRFTTKKSNCVTGEALDRKGLQSVSFSLRGREYTHAFRVCPLHTEDGDFLGNDFLKKAGAKIDLECSTMSPTIIGRVPRAFSIPRAKHTHLQCSLRVRQDAAPSSVSGRRGVQTRSSQLLSALRLLLIEVGHGLLELRTILL
jgi:hypothetical protein